MKGHIRSRGERTFVLVIELGRDESGKRRQATRTFHGGKRDAQRALNNFITEVEKGEYVEPNKITLGQHLNEWLASYGKTQLRATTYESYEVQVRCHINPALGDVKLSRLLPKQIQKLYADKLDGGRQDGKPGGLSARSVRYIHAVLKEALDHAVKWGYISRNPAGLVDPPLEEHKQLTVWTPDLAQAFLEFLEADRWGKRWYPLFALALLTGLRKGELLGLRWSAVDLEQGTIHVNRTLQRTRKGLSLEDTKTEKSRRAVPIGPVLVDALRKHKLTQAQERWFAKQGEYRDSGLVFTVAKGGPISPRNMNRSFERLLKRSGLPPIRIHDLRHSHATQLLIAGEHPKVVQERLGHAKMATTMDTYSHVTPTLQRAAAHKAEVLLLRPKTNSGTVGCQMEDKA